MRFRPPALALGFGVLLAGCSADKISVVGKYERINGKPDAILELRNDGTYTVCFAGKPCQTDKYLFEPDANQTWDRIFFHGTSLREIDSDSGWAIVHYGSFGSLCPCLAISGTLEQTDFRRTSRRF